MFALSRRLLFIWLDSFGPYKWKNKRNVMRNSTVDNITRVFSLEKLNFVPVKRSVTFFRLLSLCVSYESFNAELLRSCCRHENDARWHLTRNIIIICPIIEKNYNKENHSLKGWSGDTRIMSAHQTEYKTIQNLQFYISRIAFYIRCLYITVVSSRAILS